MSQTVSQNASRPAARPRGSAKRRIIVTRPAVDAGPLCAAIKERGWIALESPVMTIDFSRNGARDGVGDRRQGVTNLDLRGVGALAFTSANGVRAFAIASADRALPCFAVGARTADAARDAGFKSVAVADGDVDALVALIAARFDAARGAVFHPAGVDRAGDLVAGLAAHKIDARRICLYKAQPCPALTDAARVALTGDEAVPGAKGDNAGVPIFVVFYSPRSAALFLEQLLRAGLTHRLSDLVAVSVSQAVDAKLEPPTDRPAGAARPPWLARLVVGTTTTARVLDVIDGYCRNRGTRQTGRQ